MLKRMILPLLCAALLSAPAGAAADVCAELPILMYHNISPDAGRWNDYTVSPETFEADLKYLSEHGCTAVSAAQLAGWCRGESSLPEKPVMITFDDGQESFAGYALPLLEKYDMCAVVAVVGAYADLYTGTDDHNMDYSYFSWPALSELAGSDRVELASHTFDLHSTDAGRRGCSINPGESAEEYAGLLSADLGELESRFAEYVGIQPSLFAYPFGIYCPEALAVLQSRGYEILFTCDERVNRLSGDPGELLHLGRFNRPHGAGRETFFRRLGIT